MTCIVGLVCKDGTIVMGADSAATAGLDIQVRKDRKIFRTGEMLFGYTSSYRMGQLLQYSLDPPYHRPDLDIDKYMRTDFVNAVRTCLKTGGYASRDSEVERGGVFMVGYRGRLFIVMGDYQVAENQVPFASCGSGEDFAYGALTAYFKMGHKNAREAVGRALESAEMWNAGVRGPFHIEVLEAA